MQFDEAEFLKNAWAFLAAQPVSRLIGLEFRDCTEDYVELAIPIRDDLRQQHGFVHGGIIALLADNALAFAGGARLGSRVVSSELKINFLRPAFGSEIVARAWTLSSGKSLAVVRCDIFALSDGECSLCAAAQGTISRLGSQSEVRGVNLRRDAAPLPANE